MTAATAGVSIGGRLIPRYRGKPITHQLRFYGDPACPAGGYRELGIVAECEPCHWRRRFGPGHTIAELHKLVRQHAGIEDGT